MKRAFIVLFLIILTSSHTFSKGLRTLLDERDELIQEYHYRNGLKNSFFGSSSKKDLKEINESLKLIIRKDSELIKFLGDSLSSCSKYVPKHKQPIERADWDYANEQIKVLSGIAESRLNLLKVKDKRIQSLRSKLRSSRLSSFESDKITVITLLIAGFMIGYIVYLHLKIKKMKRR